MPTAIRALLMSRRITSSNADVGSLATETFGAMKIVQAFNQENREAARFHDAVEAVFGAAGHRVLRRPEGSAGLTPREVEVLRLLVRGLPNRGRSPSDW